MPFKTENAPREEIIIPDYEVNLTTFLGAKAVEPCTRNLDAFAQAYEGEVIIGGNVD